VPGFQALAGGPPAGRIYAVKIARIECTTHRAGWWSATTPSFLLGGHRILAEFGFGLGFAVLVDALIIRSLLVPALMHLIGPANWALPSWLDRILPRLAIEPTPEAPAANQEDAPRLSGGRLR
jgi:hypothetical protein